MTSPDYTQFEVHSVRPHPRGGFEVALAPEIVDPSKPYGAQLSNDLFTPSEQDPVGNCNGGIVYDGILGDPSDGDAATLTIDRTAQRDNRRARIAAGMGAAAHRPEGTLWVFPRDAAE